MQMKIRTTPIAEIKANMRISFDIQLKNDVDGMKNVITLSSRIEELFEDGSMLVQMPVYKGYHYPLPQDKPFLMKFFNESEMYALQVRFEERIEQDGFMFAKVRRASKVKPHQNRDCYRLPCSLPVTFERLWQSEKGNPPESPPFEGRMINFSDGGMLFFTNENMERGEKITLTFDFGRSETVKGKVLRVERVENGKYLFRVAVQFKNTDKAQKRRFYKYIIEQQMMERRRWLHNSEPLYGYRAVQGEIAKASDDAAC